MSGVDGRVGIRCSDVCELADGFCPRLDDLLLGDWAYCTKGLIADRRKINEGDTTQGFNVEAVFPRSSCSLH